MTIFMVTMTAVAFGLLLLVAGVLPRRSQRSVYQRQLQASSPSRAASLDARREQFLPDLLSLQRVITALLLVLMVVLLVQLLGWLLGCALAVVVALTYGTIAQSAVLQRWFQRLYDRYEVRLLDAVARWERPLRFIRTNPSDEPTEPVIGSRAELEHVIKQTAKSAITPDERALLLHGLQFGTRLVSDVMTTGEHIVHIDKKELLGPLVLDDLHKTGHSRFPVVDGRSDRSIGILDVKNLLSLDVKKSVTAEKAMDPRMVYLHPDDTLEHALSVFLHSHHSLLVVTNASGEMVGLISLRDTIEALMGRSVRQGSAMADHLFGLAARR